jgi:hypothetical protein
MGIFVSRVEIKRSGIILKVSPLLCYHNLVDRVIAKIIRDDHLVAEIKRMNVVQYNQKPFMGIGRLDCLN